MKYILAVTLLATFASAQQQPSASCFAGQPKDGAVCKVPINQLTPGSPKLILTPPVKTWEQPQEATDYRMQIRLRNQAIFTLAPAVTRAATISTYVPPPALTPLHQTSDDFSSTAGYPLGAAMSREIQAHRAKSFVKKFCRSYGSGAAWWYEFSNGDRIEGVCE